MAGIFGFFDYSKPGPGIEKDAPPKPRVVVFFEIYSRKFWNLVKINFIFTLFNLPALAVLALMTVLSQVFFPTKIATELYVDLIMRFFAGALLICIPILTVGPAQAGFTYLLRNYAREEHAFIWSDFKEHSIKNLKESLIISLIDLVVVVIVFIDIYAYSKYIKASFITAIAQILLVVSFLIYLMMHMYIYPMLVTFKLSIKEIFKNALIFSLIKFLPNLGIIILSFIILFITFISPLLGFILFPLITVSTIGLLTNFYVYPILKKYIIDKIEPAVADKNQ